jgi:inhibitor of KinA
MNSGARQECLNQLRILPCGDTALAVEFGDRIDRRLSSAVVALGQRINTAKITGVVECVPTYRSLLVHYNPLETSGDALSAQILPLAQGESQSQEPARIWRIPACYEASLAPDLDDVAAQCGLSTQEVITRHSADRYHVYMLGFLPGFPYMGDLCPELQLPRRQDPRVRVPAGAVAIATDMTAVYTYESPGGWHLIGRTPIKFFDLANTPPALLRPGDQVLFEPIPLAEFERLDAAIERGDFTLRPAVENGDTASDGGVAS